MKSKELILPIIFTGNEHIVNPSFVLLFLTEEDLLHIKKAKKWLKDNQAFDSVSMPILGKLLDSEKQENDEFGRFRFEELIIFNSLVAYKACHKNDFSATIESENFNDQL